MNADTERTKLDKKQRKKSTRKLSRTKRTMPRVSTATGGPRPGFESDPHGVTQEIEDLEYVERMKRFS
jgi:hypothetical protein